MSDTTYPLYPIFAFLGFVVSLIPLPWHLQAWNSGTCAFMIWTALTCLVRFINAIIWHGNVENVAPIWCDISTQILLAANIGTPASILCISRRLYKITSIQSVSITREDKRKNIVIDLTIAVGIPILALLLHVIVHAHRFDIVEDLGCHPVTFSTLLSFFLYNTWPVILGLISFVYSGLTLRSFFIRRAQFASLLSSNSAMNMNRYIRLMLLSICDMSFTVPMAIYILYIDSVGIPLSPWISWEDTHYHWNRVEVIPAVFWRSSTEFAMTIELTRWLSVFCAVLFFGLFGFASEAKKNYSKAFWATAKRVGYRPSLGNAKSNPPKFLMPSWGKSANQNSKIESQATLPVYSPSRKGSSFCSPDSDGVELGLYSPTSTDKTRFPPTPTSPTKYAPYSPTASSTYGCDASCNGTPSIASSRFSRSPYNVDAEEVDISEPRMGSRRPSLTLPEGFDDDFKPLPPLPPMFTDHSRYVFTPYTSPTPLRHAASMPLPRPPYELPIPTYQRAREGSVEVMVKQETRVEVR